MIIQKNSFILTVNDPIKTVRENNKFVRDIAHLLKMKIVSGPHSKYIADKGNEGVSSVTIIKTSHICVHSWDKISPGIIHLDIFSCKKFNVREIKTFLMERFNISKLLIKKG